MTKDEAVELMLKSINDDNREMCIQGGMNPEEMEAQISQSQPALSLITANMYERMKEAGLIA